MLAADKDFVDLPNPLDCASCKNEMKDPVRLACQHCFCTVCIESKKNCPVCDIEFCPSKLAVDRILKYVIDSSHESTEACANCDQVSTPMSFCGTCLQPLCQHCVSITHGAKFFASHHISRLEERGRLRGQLICVEHNAAFVLYCEEARKLMCIECFNSSSLERRNNFINIDVAHKVCREKLDRNVIKLRCFQNELKEQVEVRKRLLAETETNFKLAEEQVLDKYHQIMETLTKKKDELVEEIHSKHQKRTLQIQRQINALSSIEGPIRLNLLSASVFCSYASNLDLLHCFSELNKHIHAVMQHKLEKISIKDNNPTDYVESLRSTLRELDLRTSDSNKENLDDNSVGTFPFVSLDLWRRMDQRMKRDSNPSDVSRSLSPLSFNHSNGFHFNSSLLLLDPSTSSFEEQFQKIDTPIKQFSDETNSISKDLLDLQRDITLRRCLTDKPTVDKLFERCESLSSNLNAHLALINQIKPQLTDIWNEQLENLYKQQAMVQNRLNDLSKLQCFAQQTLEICKKLRPLVNFLSSVIGAVDNRRIDTSPIPPMEQICMQILNILPDSKQRVEAIEQIEVQRSLIRENEKMAADKEAQTLKKNLKETKVSRQRPISMIVVEQNRDRDDTIIFSQKTHRKRQKRTSQSDKTSSVCSTSPGTLSSTVSLDATSQGMSELPSPGSLSPLPPKRAESASELNTPAHLVPISLPSQQTEEIQTVKQLPSQQTEESQTVKQLHSKPLVPIPVAKNAPSAETVLARNLLIQEITEKVKRID